MDLNPANGVDDHDVAEVTIVARGIATAVAPETGITDVQAELLGAVAVALTGVSVDYHSLEPISAAELAGWHGSGEVLSSPEGFEERCLRVERVTPADVLRVARETFRRRNAVVVVVGPERRRERAAVERLLATTTAVPP